ncbi:MAG: phosphotransferase family protein [Candidatus Thorarchaeota archaeon]
METTRVEEYFSQRFPDWNDIAVTNLNDITSGWETQIVAFDVEFKKSGTLEKHCWVYRAYPGRTGKERAQSEFKVYQILQSLNYPVPNVLLSETDSSWFGKPFIIMDRVIGKTVQEQIESGNEEFRLRMISEMSQLFLRLHEIDWSNASEFLEEYSEIPPRDTYIQRIEGIRNWLNRDGADYLLPLVDWLQDNSNSILFEKYSILHNDFHPMNVLVDNEGNYFVIDWTASRVGDYRSDLAWSMLLAFIYNDNEYWQIMLREYESAAGRKVENIDYFLIEGAIRRFADILLSLSKGAESQGMLVETEIEMKSSLPLLTKLHDLVEKITGIRIERIDDIIES